MKKKWWKIS